MATLFPRRPGPPAIAIDPIRKLFPPDFLVHAGAGSGTGPLAQWRQWELDKVLVVDADPRRLVWVDAQAGRWEKCSTVLAASDGTVKWYEASNADESGLLPAADLMELWPSLTLTQQQQQSATTLDTLLQERGAEYEACWLFIECLPALPVLQGATKLLEHANVVWARVITDGVAAPYDATLSAVQQQLVHHGFVLIDVSTSSHPSIGYALFVKNQVPELSDRIAALQVKLQAMQDETASLQNKVAEADKNLQARIAQLTQERDVQAKVAAEGQQRLDGLSKANAVLEQEKAINATKFDELQRQVSALAQARDQQTKLAIDSKVQIEQLTKARDEQAKLASELKQQLDDSNKAALEEKAEVLPELELLRKEKTQAEEKASQSERQKYELQKKLESCNSDLAKAKAELEKANTTLKERDAALSTFDAELAERDRRQQMLNEELVRAEAQIDLIKDVLLRESGI